jgi:hypothetical protein
MKTLKFKTNINCGGCLAKVTPFLNEEKTRHPEFIASLLNRAF